MKKILFGILLTLFASVGFSQSYNRVNGYIRSNGTYVEPYYRTTPNSTIMDNWSTYPNVNPFNGRTGTVNPYNYNPYRRRGIY
jgi:hypothetical protein